MVAFVEFSFLSLHEYLCTAASILLAGQESVKKPLGLWHFHIGRRTPENFAWKWGWFPISTILSNFSGFFR